MTTARTAIAAAAILIAALSVSMALPVLGVPTWAHSSVAVLIGVAAGGLIAAVVRGQSERRHWTHEDAWQVLDSYAAVGDLATRLADLPVWPASAGDPAQLANQLRQDATVTGWRPAQVRDTAAALVTAATQLADVVEQIRTTSKPGHDNRVDARLVDRHQTAVGALRTAFEAFLAAARADLGVSA